jgi:hypothetical protein
LHHSHVTKSSKVKKVYEGSLLTGQEAPRSLNNKESAANKEGFRPPEPDMLHCGCPESYAVMEFVLWKIFCVTRNGVTEGWGNMVLDPRQRMFLMETIAWFTGITVDDFFAYDDEGNLQYHEDMTVRLCEVTLKTVEARKKERLAELEAKAKAASDSKSS